MNIIIDKVRATVRSFKLGRTAVIAQVVTVQWWGWWWCVGSGGSDHPNTEMGHTDADDCQI